MEANKIRLLEFLGASKRTFNVPVYQRNYDWKEEHCRRLFSDVEKIALSDCQLEHFLGTVVYVISRVQANFTEFVLIDGQQRITSVTLLLNALYAAIEDENVKVDIYESYIVNTRASENLRIKLKPIESDMPAYQKILENQESDAENNIKRNYNLFCSLIAESKALPVQLYNALSNIELVYIQLDKDKKSENPQLIFESLNSTGLSLTQADLIRNFLLMNHAYDEQNNLYKSYWVPIEKLITNSKISDFVRDYLTMKTSKISTKDKVYESFKEFVSDPNNNLDEQGVLEDLLIFAKYYSNFLRFNSQNKTINDYLEQIYQLKSTTLYPVLLYIFDDCYSYKRIDEDEIIETLKCLTTYIYRRLICGYPTNALNKIFANLIKEMEASSLSSCSAKIYDILSKKEASGTFPKDNEFEICFVQKDLYKTKIDKYTLFQMERYFSKETVDITSGISVEHIMPQKLSPQWQIALGKHSEETHAKYLHTVGNLTLTAYNPELSNKGFSDKKELLAQSNIYLNRDISKYEFWDAEAIIQRAKSLAAIAKQIWYLPEQYNHQKDAANDIDYFAMYSITSNITVTGEKPRQLILMNEEYPIASWKDLLRVLCRELFELDNTIMQNLVKHKDFMGREKCTIDNTGDNMNSPFMISDGIYIETNCSAMDTLNYCKILCTHYNISDETYFLLGKGK